MLERQIIRYIIIAILAYIVDLGGFLALIYFGTRPIIANIIVKIVAAIFGFYAHRRFTYRISYSQDILHHAYRYFGIALFYTPVSTVVLFFLMKIIPFVVVAKFSSDVILLVVTYYITSKFVFFKTVPDGKVI